LIFDEFGVPLHANLKKDSNEFPKYTYTRQTLASRLLVVVHSKLAANDVCLHPRAIIPDMAA
jgi:hypothetical protein